MWMDQSQGTAHHPSNMTDVEEIRLSRMSKEDLDRLVSNELRQGWVIKSRSHDSDGRHGITLVRRKGLPISPAALLAYANTHEERVSEFEEFD